MFKNFLNKNWPTIVSSILAISLGTVDFKIGNSAYLGINVILGTSIICSTIIVSIKLILCSRIGEIEKPYHLDIVSINAGFRALIINTACFAIESNRFLSQQDCNSIHDPVGRIDINGIDCQLVVWTFAMIFAFVSIIRSIDSFLRSLKSIGY